MSPVDKPQEGNPLRKRRLSRKEQKALKKQKKSVIRKDVVVPAISEDQVQQQQQQSEVKKKVTTKKDTTEALESSVSLGQGDNLEGYTPIPIPESSTVEASSLGKWFPKAKVIKSSVTYSNADLKSTTAKASLLLFYQYATWSEQKVDQLVAYLAMIGETRQTLGGRIRIAPEGLNATVSSVDTPTISSHQSLQYFCQDLKRFDSIFQETDFKFIHGCSPDRHFKDLKLLPVKELVFYGIRDEEAPLSKGGTHVDATKFHELLEQDETVVIDVRNHYEAAIGRFNGQQQQHDQKNGAEYVDPKMRKSTDFPKWLERQDVKEKLENKTVLMYCTGGVRCERASAFLNHKMGHAVKGVYQLQGGIERYLQAFPDGGHWKGKNYVFDKRESISAENPDGDGGVVKKVTTASAAATSKETHCCVCTTPWDRYIGKKKCTMCGVPVLMCDACMTKSRKTDILRCPLCVEENITVPAADVEYTNNGVSGRPAESCGEGGEGKAASSVLKWGGGHAQNKKDKKKEKRRLNKLNKTECQFGKECTRPDCFFSHPPGRLTVTA